MQDRERNVDEIDFKPRDEVTNTIETENAEGRDEVPSNNVMRATFELCVPSFQVDNRLLFSDCSTKLMFIFQKLPVYWRYETTFFLSLFLVPRQWKIWDPACTVGTSISMAPEYSSLTKQRI